MDAPNFLFIFFGRFFSQHRQLSCVVDIHPIWL
jgi:hypothetical protein